MQAHYPCHFVREMGCRDDEWRHWLHAALDGYVWVCDTARARVDIPNPASSSGHLCLQWRVLPERRIALLRIPRLEVQYQFEGVDDLTRSGFMQRLDLHMQRGGG